MPSLKGRTPDARRGGAIMSVNHRDGGLLGPWWWTIDRYTLTAIGLITCIGLVLIMAASPAVATRIDLSPHHFVNRQVAFLLMGGTVILIFSMLPVVVIRRLSVFCFLGCILMLIFVELFGAPVKGAQRWIHLPGFTLQPSEFVKPFLAVMVAWALARKHSNDKFPGYSIAMAMWGIVVVLLLSQPDFGMTIAVSTIFGAQLFVAGLPWLWIAMAVVLAVSGAVGAYVWLPHVAQRINTFLDPAAGDNYQTAKSLEAIRNGGVFGMGPGEGVVKQILPDSHTDFIFAVAGEELGTLVCIFIVLIFVFIIVRSFVRVFNESDLFVIYATTGLLVQFGVQAFVNMGVALSLLPNTGMTLPFVSYGGSSTLAISIAMGMILAFTRRRYGNVIARQGAVA